MERTIEFKNFEQTATQISADLYLDGSFVVRFLDNLEHLLKAEHTDITLYEYFRKAALYYINQASATISDSYQMDSTTAH